VSPQRAIKFDAEVVEDGKIELLVPFAKGTRLVVFVVEQETEPTAHMIAAAESSLDFWDNPYDEDWNDA
jgi:hypothetical protein